MKNLWRASSLLLGGHACAEHGEKENRELSLIGRYGEVWLYDHLTFRGAIFSARIARRYLPKHQWPLQKGDEIVIAFSIDELPLWIERLGVPAKSSTQAEIANARRLGDVSKPSAKSDTDASNADKLSLEASKSTQKVGLLRWHGPATECLKSSPQTQNPETTFTQESATHRVENVGDDQ